jgi:hypothetical protein
MIKTKKQKIFLILLVGILARTVSIYFFGDTRVDKEWGEMLYNLENYKILSTRSVDGIPVPNIFMPPLYALFLYLIKLFVSDNKLFLDISLIIQLVLSTISIYFIYKILSKLFSERLTFVGTIIYTLFPLSIYATSQISSITLQMFLINIFLLSFINLLKNINLKNTIVFCISSAMLILLRGEFFIFVIFSLIYLFLKKQNFWRIFIMMIMITLLVFPYVYRNYNIFGVITITKSTGFNLLKGNNPKSSVEGIKLSGIEGKVVPEIKQKIEELNNKGPIPKHDLFKDQIFLDQAIKFIREDPSKYIILYFQKFVSYLFLDINSTYPHYYSIIHIAPKLILSFLTLLGIILSVSFRANINNYLIIFYLLNIGLFSFFFILPRYSLILLPIQLILSIEGVRILIRKLFNKL